jgi:serine protease SohB
MQFIAEYGIFLLKTLTIVFAILFLVISITAVSSKNKFKHKLEIKKLNKKYKEESDSLKHAILPKHQYRQEMRQEKKAVKLHKDEKRKRIFVINFCGDIKASAVKHLRREITAILMVAKPEDEVFTIVESAGGAVHAYGLAASQLERIRAKNINLVVSVDKVAASGGYLMACVANKIIAAPFAIIGSIGVVAQLPNFHRLLKKNDIDFEQVTAGEYKRTLTVFGENTSKGRKKFQEELEDIYQIFKDFITQYRPVDIKAVATGEYWLASKAKDLNLVDELLTSDDYLLQAHHTADLYQITYPERKGLAEKFIFTMQHLYQSWLSGPSRAQQIDNIIQS